MKILFLHGWNSVPGGVKPTYLRDHGHEVYNPALSDEDFAEAVRIAQAEFDQHQPDVVVGSSRGGAVALNINSGDARLVLLCPAWKRWGTATTIKADSFILHSRADDVIPYADSQELVKNSGLAPFTLLETGSDHRLADPNSLELMLAACLYDEDNDPLDELDDNDVFAQDWTGLCYTAALKWLTVAEDSGWEIIHGTVLNHGTGGRINHAWCEREDVVVDLARPIGGRTVQREFYYRLAEPEVQKRYSAAEAALLALKTGHDGPWEEWEQWKK